MRHLVRQLMPASCVVAIVAASAPGASAQSALVDLSQPQTGKSRFVLNTDLTPADLGVVEQPKPAPAAAVSRVPACGEGCKMEQPAVPREAAYGYRDEAGSYGTRNGPRVIVVSNVNGAKPLAATPAPAPRKTFRFRRR